MINGKRVLLAFGKEALTEATAKTLQKAGFQVSTVPPKSQALPKERYDHLVQLGSEPRALIEGTRNLLEKAKKEKANFLLISDLKTSCQSPSVKRTTACEALHLAEALAQEFHHKHGVNTAILRLPVLYGPGIPLRESGSLGGLLSEFTIDQTTTPQENLILTIYGEGKDKRYYLYLTDAAEAIKTALTTNEKAGTIYHALPTAPVASKALAVVLQKMGGGRHEIHRHRGLTPLEEIPKLEGKPLPQFKPQVPLEEGVLEMLKELSLEKEQTPPGRASGRRPPKIILRLPRLRRPRRKHLIAVGILFLVVSPLLYAGGRATLAVHHLNQFRHQIGAFEFQAASRSAEAAETHLTALDHFLKFVPGSASGGPIYPLRTISRGGAEAAAALEKLTAEGEAITILIENLLKSHRGEETREQTEEEFNRLSAAFKEAENHLLTSWIYLSQAGPPYDCWLASLLDYMQQGITALKLGDVLASAAPDLLGYRGERNYLILFQNSAEVRAGGGFLGSLAQLTLKNGGIKTLTFFDSYQFDAISTPAPISFQKFLNLEEFPLRECNFYASFPESGHTIGSLFEEAQGVEIDGVVGTNLLLAKELVALSGPLELSDFERTITADNLFEVTTEEVEKDFFPGSTKKRRFLQALGEALLNKLFSLGRDSYGQLARAGWSGLRKRDLLLFLQEEDLIQTLIETNFDGRVKTLEGDFLMVVDSNYGSKANAWIDRAIDYRIFNADRLDQLQGELTITWTHHGTEAWPSGTYGNLLRVLAPKGSKLVGATLDGKNYLPEMITTEEAGKTEFSTFLAIGPQTTAILELSYHLPSTLNLKDLEDYHLYVQKQPGTVGDSFTFSFEEPFGKQISGVNGQELRRQENSLIFSGNLQYDLTFDISIEGKE